MKKSLLTTCLVIAVLGLALPNASDATVTMTSNYIRAQVRDAVPNTVVQDTYAGTGIAASTSLDASINSSFYSRIQIDYSISGGQTTLSNLLDQRRDGGLYDYSYAQENTMNFTVDANDTYDLSGSHSVTDVSQNNPGVVYMRTYLRDMTAGSYLFHQYDQSQSTLNEVFTLGTSGGDTGTPLLTGALSGNLVAGHSYRWHWTNYIYASPDPDQGASAVGHQTLTIGEVPEPATLTLLGLGLAGAGAMRWRKRKA